MLAVKIKSDEVKKFMGILLREEAFDNLEIRNVIVINFVRFEIDAKIVTEVGEGDEVSKPLTTYPLWKDIKNYVFNIIKGNIKPKSMKFIFSLPQEKAIKLSDMASVLFLNVAFDNNEVMISSGCSTKVFTLDKSLDSLWDGYIKKFLHKIDISYDEI